MQVAHICLSGLFINTRIRRTETNAWLDSFEALLIRFKANLANWLSLHWLAFYVLFLRKINRKQKR